MPGTSPTTYFKRMRLPLLAATIGLVFILTLDLFVFGSRSSGREVKELQVDANQNKRSEKTMLFSQDAWNAVTDDDDWDSIFDEVAWSSFLNEGAVGANVKDEPPLPPNKPPSGGGGGGGGGGAPAVPKGGAMKPAVVPRDGAMAAKAAVAVQPLRIMNLPPVAELLSGKAKKKSKKPKKGDVGPPEELQKFEPVPAGNNEWFQASYKKSATYGMKTVFVEDEPLYKSCASDVVVQRQWKETFLTLGPFRYMARSKNPCWYPDDGKFTCIPYFFLAGAAGPGTADVMQKIMLHPDVLGSVEQVYWWDVGRHAGQSWDSYRDRFQKETEQILLDINSMKSSTKIFGDSTSTYLASPTGWERLSGNENCEEPRITLASHLRRLRVKGLIMAVLPHPTRRLLAEFRMLSKGKPNAKQFHEYVEQAIGAYKSCFQTFSIRQCAYNKTVADSVKISLHEGMYSTYMEDWIRIFPPEQFLVLRFEDYVKSPVSTLKSIYAFLGLPEIDEGQLGMVVDPTSEEFRELVRNHNPGDSFLPETVNLLNQFYDPFIRTLSEVQENSKFTWKDT